MGIERKAVFYLISDNSLKARDLYVCRVAEKAFTNKYKVYIHTSNPEETQTLDTQLWTFRDISFVPHSIYGDNANLPPTANAAETLLPPVMVGHLTPPTSFDNILINLNPTIPAFYQQFTHIIEVAPNDENLRAIARKHYKFYQRQGYKMESHNLE